MSTVRTRSEEGTRSMLRRIVTIKGITPLMFDRYPGDNDTKLSPEQKLYFARDGQTLCVPSTNLMSFLSAKNTDSAPKRLLDPRKYKKFTEACASFVTIEALEGGEDLILTRDYSPLVFRGFNSDERCSSTGVFVHRSVARLEKGIPNPKVRPCLPLPWELNFALCMYTNKQLQEQQLHNIFIDGGIAVGIGTWRGRFGKFEVAKWE